MDLTLPAPAETTPVEVSTIPVHPPSLSGRFSVGLPDRDLTAEEVGHVLQRALDFFEDVEVAAAMTRWAVGMAWAHAPGVPWEEVQAVVRTRVGEEYGRTLLYECRSFFEAFPRSETAERKVRQMIDGGFYSWTRFRAEMGIGRRSERAQIEDGLSPQEQAAKKIERVARQLGKADEELEDAVRDLHEDDPLRAEAMEMRAHAFQHIQDSARLLAEGAQSAEERGPWRSEAYRRFVKSHACAWTGSPEVDFAHTGRHRGMSERASDATGVPQAHWLHMGLHNGDERALATLANGPTEAEVVASLLIKFVTGANDGPVHLVENGLDPNERAL